MPGGIHPPLEVIATWPKPNYESPQTQPKIILIFACILGPLTVTLLLARLWVRIRMQHNAGLDDWLMLAAIFPIITLTAVFPLVTEVYGFNRHIWDVHPSLFPIQRKYVMVIETVFCVGSGLIKISILLFYRRLSDRAISNTFRWATWISIGFIAAYSIAFALIPIFMCKPIAAFWEQVDFVKVTTGYKYKCLNEGADVFTAGVISVVQDLLTAMLPTFLYWNLRVPFQQKVALFGIFAIGYGVVILGAMRAYASWQIFFETYDVTWVAGNNWLWSMLELHIGAICANAPALKVFFKNVLKLDKITSRSRSRSHSKPLSGSNNTSSANKHSGSSTPYSIASKLSFWKRNHSIGKSGYLSEPHTDISVDMHGGLRKDKGIYGERGGSHQRNSLATTTNSTNKVLGRYDADIEMGSLESDSHTGDFEVQTLPPMLSQPPTPTDATMAITANANNSSKGSTPFPGGQRNKNKTLNWQSRV